MTNELYHTEFILTQLYTYNFIFKRFIFNVTMKKILETPRLYLRKLIPEDLDSVANMFADALVMRYVGTGIVLSRETAEKSITKWNQYEEKFGFANWAVVRKEDDTLIGECGFNWLPDNSDIEISYMFDKPFWVKATLPKLHRKH